MINSLMPFTIVLPVMMIVIKSIMSLVRKLMELYLEVTFGIWLIKVVHVYNNTPQNNIISLLQIVASSHGFVFVCLFNTHCHPGLDRSVGSKSSSLQRLSPETKNIKGCNIIRARE